MIGFQCLTGCGVHIQIQHYLIQGKIHGADLLQKLMAISTSAVVALFSFSAATADSAVVALFSFSTATANAAVVAFFSLSAATADAAVVAFFSLSAATADTAVVAFFSLSAATPDAAVIALFSFSAATADTAIIALFSFSTATVDTAVVVFLHRLEQRASLSRTRGSASPSLYCVAASTPPRLKTHTHASSAVSMIVVMIHHALFSFLSLFVRWFCHNRNRLCFSRLPPFQWGGPIH